MLRTVLMISWFCRNFHYFSVFKNLQLLKSTNSKPWVFTVDSCPLLRYTKIQCMRFTKSLTQNKLSVAILFVHVQIMLSTPLSVTTLSQTLSTLNKKKFFKSKIYKKKSWILKRSVKQTLHRKWKEIREKRSMWNFKKVSTINVTLGKLYWVLSVVYRRNFTHLRSWSPINLFFSELIISKKILTLRRRNEISYEKIDEIKWQ